MTYTCATEGCGEPIYFSELSKRWRHEVSDNITCNLRGDYVAHPAGGTNTTPPEELERDVTELHEILEWADGFMDDGCLSDLSRMIRAYATSVAQEAVDRARDSLYETVIDRRKAEIDDLREQLDRALVTKWSPGDELLDDTDHLVTVVEPIVAYRVRGADGHEWWTGWNESDLVPLETETCPLDHRKNDLRTSGFRPWEFCPLCGKSLTKEGEA